MTSISDFIAASSRLTEGMWAGDLNDLISPTITIDEFKSRIDSKALVVGVYIRDLDAANDLNRFLQKSHVDVLYTEVSPATDQRGFYIVFIELMRNDKLVDNIIELMTDVTSLTNVTSWNASVYGNKKPIELSKDNLKVALAKDEVVVAKASKKSIEVRKEAIKKQSDRLREKLNAAKRRLVKSALESVEISNGRLVLETRAKKQHFSVEYVGPLSGLDEGAVSTSFSDLRECRALALDLGEGWDVVKIENSLVAHNLIENFVVSLRVLD